MNGKIWDYDNPFLIEVVVDESQIDGLNHVNNAVYVTWCQDAGWQHSMALGLGIEHYQELDRAMAIRHGEYDYVQAAYLGDELSVATWLTASDGKLLMERRFQVVRKRDGATLLRGRWDLVCIQISSGRPKRLPVEFRDVYGAAVVEVEKDSF
jgi:acyl-CoA thioester hydrolase